MWNFKVGESSTALSVVGTRGRDRDHHRSGSAQERVHGATAVEPATTHRLDMVEVEASLAGYRRLLRWADRFSERRWAVENARALGRHLAQ